MTETEWLACDNPLAMLSFLKVVPSSRKSLLLTEACVCRVGNAVSERCRVWGERAGQLADQFATVKMVMERLGEDWEAVELEINSLDVAETPPNGGGRFLALLSILVIGWDNPTGYLGESAAWVSERKAQTAIVKELFGNPFRAVAVAPSWLTPTVVQLAEHIYNQRAFDQMPILADALHDAGCDNSDILEHCRGLGPHVRGCWVVDKLLKKE